MKVNKAKNDQQALEDLRSRLRGIEGVVSLGLRRGEAGSCLLLRARAGSPALSLPSVWRRLPLRKEVI